MDTLTKKKRQALAVIIGGAALIGAGIATVVFLFMRHAASAIPPNTSTPPTTSPIPFAAQLLGFVAIIFPAITLVVATFQKICGSYDSFWHLLKKELGKLRPSENRLWRYFAVAFLLALAMVPKAPKLEDTNLVATLSDSWATIFHGVAPTVNTPFFPDAPIVKPVAVIVPLIDWSRTETWFLRLSILFLGWHFRDDIAVGIRNFIQNFEKHTKKVLIWCEKYLKSRPQKTAVAIPSTPSTPPQPNQPPTAEPVRPLYESIPHSSPGALWTHIMKGEVAASVITALAFGLGHALFHEIREAHDIRKGLVKA